MKVLVFDTETSGLNPGYNVILQLSYQIVDTATWDAVKEVNHYFAWPSESSRVSSKAIEVNGLTKEFLGSQTLSNKQEALTEFVKDKDSVELLVAHNLEFDKSFIIAECKEFGVKYATSGWANVYDTMKKTTNICCIEKNYGYGGYKYPKLSELADFLGISLDGLKLHDSSADVELTKLCLKALIDKGYYHPEKRDSGISVHLHVESAEDYTFTFIDDNGKEIPESVIESITSKKNINATKQELLKKWAEEAEQERDQYKNFMGMMPTIKETNDYQKDLESLKPAVYVRNQYEGERPDRHQIESVLIIQAKEQVKSMLFWTNKAKRREYVEERLDKIYEAKCQEYEDQKEAFEKSEDEKESKFNAEALETFNAKKSFLQGNIGGNSDTIKKALQQIQIESLPFSLNVDPIMVDAQTVSLDVMLPSVSELPQLYGCRLASGNYKIKNLSDKEKREDYAKCVTGLAFFLAASYINVAPVLETVIVTGNAVLESEGESSEWVPIYTVKFTRDELKDTQKTDVACYEAIQGYPHVMNLSKTFIFKPIKPVIK